MSSSTILLAEFMFNGGFEPRYAATESWFSKSGDSIGVRHYLGRITLEPTFAVSVSCLLWRGLSTTSIGSLELSNTDFALTEWLSLDSRDCECRLRLVNRGDGYDDAVLVARCIVDKIALGSSTIKVTLKGRDTLLDRPLQHLRYAIGVPNVELEGVPLPVLIGAVRQAEPFIYDASVPEFRLNDYALSSITNVYSGGSVAVPPGAGAQWAYSTNSDGFTMTVNPAARVLVDAVGRGNVGSDQLTDTGVFYVPANWSGGAPVGWTIGTTGSPTYTVTEASGIGAQFEGTTVDGSNKKTLQKTSVLTNGNWYVIVGRIARNMGGALKFNNPGVVVKAEGEFTIIFKADATTTFSVTHDPDEVGDIDITLEYVYVYALADDTSTSLTEAVTHLAVAHGGFVKDDVDLTGYDGPNPTIGLYVRGEAKTTKDAIAEVMHAATGWSWIGPDGKLRIGHLNPPDIGETPDIILSRLNIIEAYPTFEIDDAPGASDTYAAGKNFSRYSEEELAGITYTNQPPFMADFRFKTVGANKLDRAYRHAIGADPIGTYMTLESEAQAEADRITYLLGLRQSTSEVGLAGFWTISAVARSDFAAAILQPQMVARLNHENAFGPYHGLNSRILAVSGRYRDNRIRLIVYATPRVVT